jgi:cysteinyl-tRNA synthetase
MRFHNTLGNRLEEFTPLEPGVVKMYHCGPTVYGRQHIGNLSMFVFTDVLRRSLEYKGLKTRPVINFTDFGHLTGDNEGDADTGEDKMTKGLRQEGLSPTLENMLELGKKYAGIFLKDIETLNVDTRGITFPYASEYVGAQIEMIQTLEDKGFTYQGQKGVYFDTSKFPEYGKLGNINLEGLREGARVTLDKEKRNPTDFILWKSSDKIGWDSPWGKGFPGWHIECSAMIRKILGDQIDIHTGGIEHIPVHHQNEIAQSESATGKKPFAQFWLHRAHLQINNEKIAKSAGTAVYLSELIERGYNPLAFRYLLLGSHYRTGANFTWEALEAAENAYKRLKTFMLLLDKRAADGEVGVVSSTYKQEFTEAIENDLNTPEALAVVWKLAKNAGDDITYADAKATLLDFDQVLGLKLTENEYLVAEIPPQVQELLTAREQARQNKDFDTSDKLREQIEALGYKLKDTDSGQEIELN